MRSCDFLFHPFTFKGLTLVLNMAKICAQEYLPLDFCEEGSKIPLQNRKQFQEVHTKMAVYLMMKMCRSKGCKMETAV